jgi:hypothetical protein
MEGMPPAGNGWSPDQYLAYLDQLYNSSYGQAYQRATDQTNQLNRQQVLEGMKNQRDQIAIQRGAAAANQWYQRAQLEFAKQQHQDVLAQQARDNAFRQTQFETGATGMYNGGPTWERQEQTAGLTGDLNGTPTLQKLFGEAGLTGQYNGAPTLAARGQEGQMTGYYNGAPTMARESMQAGLTGYYGGAPTFQREQAASGIALQAAGLGAQLGGPRNWGNYLRASSAVRNAPLLSNTPNVGAHVAPPGGPLTLVDVLGDYGGGGTVGGGGAAGGGAPGTSGLASVLQNTAADVSRTPANADLGLSDFEAGQLMSYFDNPGQAPTGWLETKSPDEKEYLRGLMSLWGRSPATVESQYKTSRPGQGSIYSAY